jgi:hypothetical protein
MFPGGARAALEHFFPPEARAQFIHCHPPVAIAKAGVSRRRVEMPARVQALRAELSALSVHPGSCKGADAGARAASRIPALTSQSTA